MMTVFVAKLEKRLSERREEILGELLDGEPEDYASYRHLIGMSIAFRQALEMIDTILDEIRKEEGRR